jgi:hypothetical protein
VETDRLEDLGLNGIKILKSIIIMIQGVGWINLAGDRDKWQAVVNTGSMK